MNASLFACASIFMIVLVNVPFCDTYECVWAQFALPAALEHSGFSNHNCYVVALHLHLRHFRIRTLMEHCILAASKMAVNVDGALWVSG